MPKQPIGQKSTHTRADRFTVDTPHGKIEMRVQGKDSQRVLIRSDNNAKVLKAWDASVGSRGEIAKHLGVRIDVVQGAIKDLGISDIKNFRGGAAVVERARRKTVKRDPTPLNPKNLPKVFQAQIASFDPKDWVEGKFQNRAIAAARAETLDRVEDRILPVPEGYPTTFVACLNDLHVGEISSMSGGAVVWDNDLMARTVAHYTELVIDQIKMLSGKYRIETFVLADIGDIIDGQGIFPGQEMHIEGEAPEQVRDAGRVIAGMLYTIHHRTHLPIKMWWCPGNHDVARFGKGRESEFGRAIVREIWRNCLLAGVDVKLARDPDGSGEDTGTRKGKKKSRGHGEITTIKDATTGAVVVLKHAFPRNITTPSARHMLSSWAIRFKACAAISGHWHGRQMDEPHDGVLCVRSGSLVPGNAYADAYGLSSTPSQAWLILGKDRQGRARVLDHGHIECQLDEVARSYRNADGYIVTVC